MYFYILNFAPLTEQCLNIHMKTAKNKDCKILPREEEVQVCWSQYLFWVLNEVPQNDVPISLPNNTSIRYYIGTTCSQ